MLKSIMQKDDTPAHCYDSSSCSVTEQGYWPSSLSRRLCRFKHCLRCLGGSSSIVRRIRVGLSGVWYRIWKRRAGLVLWLLVKGELDCWSSVWFILGGARVKFNSICPLIIRPLLASHSHTRLARGPTPSDEVGR